MVRFGARGGDFHAILRDGYLEKEVVLFLPELGDL
jgi:hypothetical protein